MHFFRVLYHGISHESHEFSWYAYEPRYYAIEIQWPTHLMSNIHLGHDRIDFYAIVCKDLQRTRTAIVLLC